MKLELAYGRDGLSVDLPDTTDVITPTFTPGLPDERASLIDAMRSPIELAPLRDLVSAGDRVVIVHTDITRATPNDRMLSVVVDELEAAGIRPEDITFLNGLGTHRPQTPDELRALLGDRIVDNYRCLQHDCHDNDNLVSLGETSNGHPVRINKEYYEADVKILTGFIEPHFFAGFSGGPKAILPSLSGYESVFTNHGLQMVAHEHSTWGVMKDNPIRDEMLEVALKTDPTFLLNVTLNTNKEITGVFAGDMVEAHEKGAAYCREMSMAPVAAAYDIVVTTNSGYPLDQNLYQSVKGMSAAAEIVKPGGAIVIATACEDGLPDHGLYAQLLREAGSPQAVIDTISQPGYSKQDQWQVQIQAQIQMKADVYVYSEGVTESQIREALFIPMNDVAETVRELMEKIGPGASICALPDGPMTIPYLREAIAAY